jgi:hypothetical protein
VAEQGKHGGDQGHPHREGVDEHADTQARGDRLQGGVGVADEAGEHGEQDRGY